MKKYVSLILVLLLTAGLLFGCGAASNDMAGEAIPDGKFESAGSMTQDSLSEPGEGESPDTPAANQQKLIRKIWINAETENLDGLLSQVEQQIAQLAGYVENREVYNGTTRSGNNNRYADLTIRIPADKLNSFVTHVSENANVTSTNETADDITLSYVATQSRITALETEQTRLLELLAKAETMDDLLKIESRLTDVRTELEAVTSQLRTMDNQVNYGTIYLRLDEVKEYTETKEPETVWDRIRTGFSDSLENLGSFFTDLFVFLIVALPYLVVLAVIPVTVLLVIRFIGKKRKAKEKKENT